MGSICVGSICNICNQLLEHDFHFESSKLFSHRYRAMKRCNLVWFLNIICICAHDAISAWPALAIDFLKLTFFRVVWDKTIFETWKVENHFKITLKWFYEIIGSLRKFYLCKIMDNLLLIICLRGNSSNPDSSPIM